MVQNIKEMASRKIAVIAAQDLRLLMDKTVASKGEDFDDLENFHKVLGLTKHCQALPEECDAQTSEAFLLILMQKLCDKARLANCPCFGCRRLMKTLLYLFLGFWVYVV